MRICCISDIHGNLPEIPDCDLLLLAGDYPRYHRNRMWYSREFRSWLQFIRDRGIPVVGVAGNHDFVFEKDPEFARSLPWTYLQDQGFDFGPTYIYGSPWQPRFYDWAFNLDEPELAKKWALIPSGTDILVLHGPPHGYGDAVARKITEENEHEWPSPEHVGSPSLLARILEVKPKLVVAGHIHSGYGVYQINNTIFVNASHCNEQYQPVNKPIMVEL